MTEIKDEVRQFYDQVGWTLISDDIYQNARYEDLRPVSREYIHRCHLRVARHLKQNGYLLLDAGSGPVQYPEYLEYSRNYQYRVCADISITALVEARKRLEDKGLYVVADIANLPFKSDAFDGVVSLHTIHHLPEDEHLRAYQELYRVQAQGSRAVVVNGWPTSSLMAFFEPFIRISQRIWYRVRRLNLVDLPLPYEETGGQNETKQMRDPAANNGHNIKSLKRNGSPVKPQTKKPQSATKDEDQPKGTFISRHDVEWVKNEVGVHMPVEIRVWRSASVRWMRSLIHPALGGRYWLRLLFWLEERFPYFFGERGKYPLIIIRKQEADSG